MKDAVGDCPKEEQYPLLMLFLEEGQNHSKKRGLFFDKTRYRGLTSGANAVLSQWPSQISTCMLALVVGGAALLFFLLIAIATSVDQRYVVPRCIHRPGTAGLVVTQPTIVYLLHDDQPWQQHQLDAVEQIAINYASCRIELTILYNMYHYNSNETYGSLPTLAINPDYDNITHINDQQHGRRKRELLEKIMENMKPVDYDKNTTTQISYSAATTPPNEFNILIGSKVVLQKINEDQANRNEDHFAFNKPKVRDLHDLLHRYPDIIVRVISTTNFFMFSPLSISWSELNPRTLLFAARVMRLWDNGGISFTLPELSEEAAQRYKIKSGPKFKAWLKNGGGPDPVVEERERLDLFIKMDYGSFQRLPAGVVTADDQGVHMETRVPCHAFFSELLMNLKVANSSTTVAQLIQNTLRTFCLTGAVDTKYCNAHKRLKQALTSTTVPVKL